MPPGRIPLCVTRSRTEDTYYEKERGQKEGNKGNQRPKPAIRGWFADCSKIGREGKERTRDRLGRGIASNELIVSHPSCGNHFSLQQRQDDMTSAKDQGTHTEERVKERH